MMNIHVHSELGLYMMSILARSAVTWRFVRKPVFVSSTLFFPLSRVNVDI